MAIAVSFHGAELLKPGAYSWTDVQINASQNVLPMGTVGIVGEAYGGAPGSEDGWQEFDAGQLYEITQKYIRGPIVDAARALLEPSKDPDIGSGASRIKIYKTNGSKSAEGTALEMDDAAVPKAIFTLNGQNYGQDENFINFYITEGVTTDDHASVTSGAITLPVTLTVGGTIVVAIGGANYTFTVPGGGGGPHASITPIVDMLNDAANWAPSKPVVASADGVDKIKLELDTSLVTFDGYESMHEYAILNYTGLDADTELEFRKRVNFTGDGQADGTFEVADVTHLAVGMWTQIRTTAGAILPVIISGISGAAAPYTVELNNGTIDLSAYTVAAGSRIFGSCPIVNEETLQVQAGTGGMSRGSRGSRVLVVKKNDRLETVPENANETIFRIRYIGVGTACEMSVKMSGGHKTLTTTVTGGPGSEALNMILSEYVTVEQMVDYVNNFNGGVSYTCYTDYFNADVTDPSTIDFYDDIDIKTMPLNVKNAKYEMNENINSFSQLITSEIEDDVYGQLALVSSTARTFLSGASNGHTTNSMVQDALDILLTAECDIVLALFSQDASKDILDGLTDTSSTYTIASINAMVDAHCRRAGTIQNRRERMGWLAMKAPYLECRETARLMNSQYTSLCIQDIMLQDSLGAMQWKNPHIFAAVCAGLEAGAEIGLPLTKKAMNAYGIRHQDFEPVTQYNDAIRNGIFFAEKPDRGGVVIVCANTTYQRDSNFVYNRRSVMRAAQATVKTLRGQLEDSFVGKARMGGSTLVSAIKVYAQSILRGLLEAGVLAPDAKNGGLGYRDLKVNISGGIVTLNVIITLVSGVDFVLANITLAPISDVA